MSVVIVDDSEVVREHLRTLFKEHDIPVVGDAEDITMGLSLILAHKPSHVILDIQMPGGSGFSLLNYLRSRRIDSTVIIFSNYSNELYRAQAQMFGANYYYDKSTDCDRLLEVIKGDKVVIG